MWVQHLIFYVFSLMLIASSSMVISVRNPVYAVLFLVAAFICSAVIWMLLQAEFLALVLLFVYVGAVMTLFLFVVMMLNVDLSKIQEGFVKYTPFALAIVAVMFFIIIKIVSPHDLHLATHPLTHGLDFSDTQRMGEVMFTHYIYPFELAAMILLVAMISAISLAFTGRRKGTKSQNIAAQHAVKAKDRVRIVKMPSQQQPKEDK